MADNFTIVPFPKLLSYINFDSTDNSILGIPYDFHFFPDNERIFTERYNKKLHVPLGVAAGPHTQLAQNIVSAWICGARYIELKTVQTLDELKISKPCIDASDEAYNCEWSQELKIEDSYNQYLEAWIIIHLIAHKWGIKDIGTIFNMSAGYNLEGILKDNMQWFFSKMQNCKVEKNEKLNLIFSKYPWISDVNIPDCISDNITLSTMHGCPPDEVEKIATYLIKELKLNTTVKLNPTLLGKNEVNEIISKLGFNIKVPSSAFDHDLKYNESLNIIKNLEILAQKYDLKFGIKLINTLETENIKQILPTEEKIHYMSGRVLHPIAVNLALKLQQDFEGNLDISFSAGADFNNFPELIACNLKPVTVCTDLLKPGGYFRLKQYTESLINAFDKAKVDNLSEFIISKSLLKTSKINQATIENLKNYSQFVLESDYYKNKAISENNIKTKRPLNYFDCISAPCIDNCPTNQDIPSYMYFTTQKLYNNAIDKILETNPFPEVTGKICDNPCQLKCTRINYDEPLKIREIKRFVSENAKRTAKIVQEKEKIRVTIIGAGPSGLSCAYYLALQGVEVTVYEKNSYSGGMVQSVIPVFRLTDDNINSDIKNIADLGITIHYNTKVNEELFGDICKRSEYIYISTGAQLSKKPDFITFDNLSGVIDPLEFLSNAKKGVYSGIGKNIAIIGGGNTAMDVARTAWRVIGDSGKVTIVYRRTIAQMPADKGEIKAVIDEGIDIIELAYPKELIVNNNKVTGIRCVKMQLSEKEKSGRNSVNEVPESDFILNFDTIIPAIGQELDIDFIDKTLLETHDNAYKTMIPSIYIGGDALRGASTAINAIADGRKTANLILEKANITRKNLVLNIKKSLDYNQLVVKRGKRKFAINTYELSVSDRRNFHPYQFTFNESQAIEEADRCLYCDELCNICVTVCPNHANYHYFSNITSFTLPKAIIGNNGIELKFDKKFEIKQAYQVVNIKEFCNECGNCSTFCPTSGAPYKDKPHFYLTHRAFKNAETGYLINKIKDRIVLIYKDKNSIKTLTLINRTFFYETDQISAEISEVFEVKNVRFKATCVKEAYFGFAAEMFVLFNGLSHLAD